MNAAEGDPGKLAYLRDPNYQVTPAVHGFPVHPDVCPGCMMEKPANDRKWPHTFDKRCKLGFDRCEFEVSPGVRCPNSSIVHSPDGARCYFHSDPVFAGMKGAC